MKKSLCVWVGVLATALAGCTSSVEKQKAALESPIVVKAKQDDRAQFGTYKTWALLRVNPTSEIDPRLVNPETAAMLSDALEKEMFKKGYERVETESSPDLIMSVHATVEDIDQKDINGQYNGTSYPELNAQIKGEDLSDRWSKGSIVFILFDGKTRQAVWGAGAQAEVFPDLAPDVRRQRLNKATALLLESLPASAGK